MLAGVSDHKNPVVWIELLQKRPHLPRAGEAGFVEHVKVAGIRFGAILSTGKEALERGGVDSGLAELARCLGGRGEALDRVAALFRALANGIECRCLTGSGEPLQAVDTVGGVENFLNYCLLR